MASEMFEVRPIGWVESPLLDRATAPKQGVDGAPDAWLVFDHGVRDALRDLECDTEVLLLTWLHCARRNKLVARPRDDPSRPELGVFSTRSPDRPNPIGLHRVQIVTIDDTRIRVRNLEALDGTPILDLKPVIDAATDR